MEPSFRKASDEFRNFYVNVLSGIGDVEGCCDVDDLIATFSEIAPSFKRQVPTF